MLRQRLLRRFCQNKELTRKQKPGEHLTGFLFVHILYNLMIKNSDGTPLQLNSSELRMFDPENPDLTLLNSFDAEAIRIGGSPIFYYELFVPPSTIDPLYLESRGKLFSNNPVQLYAMYEPIPSQNFQGNFGIDAPDEIIFELNYREVLKILGHPPKDGSRIFTPHKRENWMIIQRNAGEFRMWGELRIQLICQRFQEDVVVGEGKVTQRQPDFKIN